MAADTRALQVWRAIHGALGERIRDGRFRLEFVREEVDGNRLIVWFNFHDAKRGGIPPPLMLALVREEGELRAGPLRGDEMGVLEWALAGR